MTRAVAVLATLRSYQFPIAVFIGMRVCLSLWAWVVTAFVVPPPPADLMGGGIFVFSPGGSEVYTGMLETWYRWDTHWYVKIAVLGYDANDGSIAFFPLYPLLIRIIGSALGEHWILAALLISNCAALASFILLYHLVAHRFDTQVARRTLVYLVAFPLAFFFFAGYAESLFLLFALLALHDAQENRWWRAGLWNGLAVLTRAQGLALGIPLLVEYYAQFRHNRTRVSGFVLFLLTSAIGVAYWVYLWIRFGNWAIWSREIAKWRVNSLPGESIVLTVQKLFAGQIFGVANNVIDLFAVIFFLGMIGYGLLRLPRTLAIFSAALILPPLLSVQIGAPQLPLASLPRYGIVLFPVFISLGLIRLSKRLEFLGVVVSLVLQAFFVALFVVWIWVA